MAQTVDDFLDNPPSGQSVTVVVGENGAGKSRLLRELAIRVKSSRPVFAVANTVYDRFVNLRGIRRISSSYGRYLPQNMLKNSIISAAQNSLVGLRSVADTLYYCGYRPEVGMLIRFKGSIDNSMYNGEELSQVVARVVTIVENEDIFKAQGRLQIDELTSFLPLILNRDYRGQSVFRLTFDQDAIRSSQSEQAARILVWEPILRAAGIIERIDLLLRSRDETSFGILMSDASSGQLTLIASLIFLSVSVTDGSIVLIDEPENSLHPLWQREYVERLLILFAYRNVTIVIATHAPIVVSGAQLVNDADVKIYRLSREGLELVTRPLKPGEKTSLEETVFESFGTVTPANHFVSETLSKEFTKLRAGTTTAREVKEIVDQMKAGSFDRQQTDFLNGVVGLARDIEDQRRKFGDTIA